MNIFEMNLETLRRLAQWADKIAKAQRELSDALSDELAKAEGRSATA